MFTIENIKSIWVVVSLGLIPITIAYFILFKKVTSILALRHPEIYKSLGEINFVKNNSISSSSRFMKFIIFGKYKRTSDLELYKYSGICRFLLISGLFLFTISFIIPIVI